MATVCSAMAIMKYCDAVEVNILIPWYAAQPTFPKIQVPALEVHILGAIDVPSKIMSDMASCIIIENNPGKTKTILNKIK